MKQENENGKFATRYSTKLRKGIVNNEPSMTKQSFKDEADINNILKKYVETGVIPSSIKENPLYGDFSSVPSYQEAQHIVANAQLQFDGLPSKVRREFNNNPEEFLAYATDPKNADKLVEFGLAFAKESPILEEAVGEESPKVAEPKAKKAKDMA